MHYNIGMTGKISTGGDIDAYCRKCKLDLEHIVVAMVAGVVVKVKCKTCGSTHNFRGVAAVRSRASGRSVISSKSAAQGKAAWETAVEAADGPELPYDMAKSYRAGDLIVHSVFGKGIVQRTFFKKCSVLFRDKERAVATSNT